MNVDNLEEEVECAEEAYPMSICRVKTKATLKIEAQRATNYILSEMGRPQDHEKGPFRTTAIAMKLPKLEIKKLAGVA